MIVITGSGGRRCTRVHNKEICRLLVGHALLASFTDQQDSFGGGRAYRVRSFPDIKKLGETLSGCGFKAEEIDADYCYVLFATRCK